MNNSFKKEWLVRTKSREVLGPFSQSELVEQLNQNAFGVQDEICNSLGNWLSASVLAHRDSDEITRTSSRMTTQSLDFTKSDLTPTPTATTTDKIPLGNETTTKSSAHPFTHPLKENSQNHHTKTENPPGAHSEPKQPSSSAAKYPLLTAVVLSIVTVFILNRPKTTTRETSEVNDLKVTEAQNLSPIAREARALLKVGKGKQALKILADYHESHSKTDMSHVPLYAALLITEGESVLRAKRLLEQVLNSSQSAPLKAEAHLWLGYLLLSEDELDMGESHFLEALELNPKDAAARFNLGRAYLKQEKSKEALDYFQLAELEMPNLWLVHIYKGWAKHSLQLNHEASLSFKTAINDSKDRWLNYIYQSIFFLKTKEYDAARESLLKMLGRDPDYERLSPVPIGFFQNRTNYDEYLNAYNEVMAKAPEDERMMGKIYINYLANPLSHSEDWRKMDALANRTNNILPRILSIKMMLRHSVDLGYLKMLISKLPPNLDFFGPYSYVLRGLAREKLNQLPEALLDYKKALALDPDCAAALWYQYDLFRKLHRVQEAKETLKNLLATHPLYIPALEQSSNF